MQDLSLWTGNHPFNPYAIGEKTIFFAIMQEVRELTGKYKHTTNNKGVVCNEKYKKNQ